MGGAGRHNTVLFQTHHTMIKSVVFNIGTNHPDHSPLADNPRNVYAG